MTKLVNETSNYVTSSIFWRHKNTKKTAIYILDFRCRIFVSFVLSLITSYEFKQNKQTISIPNLKIKAFTFLWANSKFRSPTQSERLYSSQFRFLHLNKVGLLNGQFKQLLLICSYCADGVNNAIRCEQISTNCTCVTLITFPRR